MMRCAQTLISTVGTSLFFPNLASISPDDADPARRRLAHAFAAQDWDAVADALTAFDSGERVCGAEINALTSVFAKGYASSKANLFFCHSAADDGRAIAEVLVRFYRRAGHTVVEAREIADLQDEDPRRFRTGGLRNLAKVVCRLIRDHGSTSCAINATGGYKAQIAIAVMMGQALGVPVYYKHERFDEIIAFPPMPVAFDFEVGMRLSGLLGVLEREGQAPASLLDDEPGEAEVLESLVERVNIDGRDYLALSPAGQIFHETFRERFRTRRDQVLPPAVPPGQKQPIHSEDSGHMRSRAEVHRFLEAVTREVPQVRRCATFWSGPDLSEETRFRLGSKGIEGIFSDGTYTVKFAVDSSAQTDGQRAAVVAALNDWLEKGQ
jgi:putative CRISPR-associated protein (TIGR02619 family)